MVEKKYKKILILEDDARFVYNFKQILLNLDNQMKSKEIDWELL